MIDMNRLTELREEIGASDLMDVVTIFLDETDEVMSGLAGLPATELGAQMHFLKGSALNLGLVAFALMCQEGEARASEGDPNPVNINALTNMYEASKSIFLNVLAREKAS